MLSQNRAISCSPKVFANLGTDYTSTENAPIPLPLAKELREGDTLIPGKSHTVLVSGVGQHCMPALVKARESFPLAVVEKYNAAIKSEICMVSLNRLNKLVGDCDTILSAIAKTEVVLCFSYAKGRLSLKATNSSTEFTGSVPTQADWVGTAEFRLPLDEMKAALALGDTSVYFKSGSKGETYLIPEEGSWVMMPSWSK